MGYNGVSQGFILFFGLSNEELPAYGDPATRHQTGSGLYGAATNEMEETDSRVDTKPCFNENHSKEALPTVFNGGTRDLTFTGQNQSDNGDGLMPTLDAKIALVTPLRVININFYNGGDSFPPR